MMDLDDHIPAFGGQENTVHRFAELETEGKADTQELVVDCNYSVADSGKLLIGLARLMMHLDSRSDRGFGKVNEAGHTARYWIERKHMHLQVQ